MRPISLDDRDIAILSILSREGRISKADLARRVNLSPTPCWQRLARMEGAGLIRGYRADIALAGLGPHVTVFVTIELENHRAENFRLFEASIDRIDAITGCWALGGGFDYLMQVVARDIPAYQALMDDLLDRRAGVKRYFSHIVTKDVKSGPPPFADLMGGSS
ncbi:Lrp/AsnC family transcriptional regulator [Szabonella alba]|uniref:Lrp/AsnC family transcriptional regulator n=1 Tax=Szabonella alba TaxID=2804194 RepID=A0A8K0V7H8_9RHOB|nr:Lrp/AsnC family transcriptional regulator [Szabonella alba]MBL4916897.1 Lrp/AsnC family transcriptional regulator [Szabonella alba]